MSALKTNGAQTAPKILEPPAAYPVERPAARGAGWIIHQRTAHLGLGQHRDRSR